MTPHDCALQDRRRTNDKTGAIDFKSSHERWLVTYDAIQI